MKRSSIELRKELSDELKKYNSMTLALKTSIALETVESESNDHLVTLLKAQATIGMLNENINNLINHIDKLVQSYEGIFDSDENELHADTLQDVVDAVKYAAITRPEILSCRKSTIEDMEEKINALPY